jgi:hypothetical protein
MIKHKANDFLSRQLSHIMNSNKMELVNLVQYYMHCNIGVI